jgi:geranylgeranyl reductase family protein
MMIKENRFDAIVIGAGPAGSTAAYLMAKSGFHVLVLDKQRFPRNKLCGGLLTRKTIRLLEKIFQTPLDYLISNRIIAHQSSRYGLNLLDKACIRGKLEYPFHFVDRLVYDSFWLNKARQAGAQFKSGDKVISLDPLKNQVATAKGQTFSGTYILVADGAPSRLHRLLTAGGFIEKEKKAELATALEVVVSHKRAPALPDCPVIYLGFIRWGYAWCFPRKDIRILGMCGLNKKSGKFLKQGMMQFLKMANISNSNICAVKSHALPYGNYLTQPGVGNILMLGDACGLVDPLLGEGIYYAHKSGQLAAMAAIQSLPNPQNTFRLYRKHIYANIIPELKFARMGRQIIFSLPGSWPGIILAALLKINSRKCEETIQGQRSFKWFRPLSENGRQQNIF